MRYVPRVLLFLARKLPFDGDKGDPNALVVRHLCGNAWCVNEKHLTVGTHEENMLDMRRHMEKEGRSYKGVPLSQLSSDGIRFRKRNECQRSVAP